MRSNCFSKNGILYIDSCLTTWQSKVNVMDIESKQILLQEKLPRMDQQLPQKNGNCRLPIKARLWQILKYSRRHSKLLWSKLDSLSKISSVQHQKWQSVRSELLSTWRHGSSRTDVSWIWVTTLAHTTTLSSPSWPRIAPPQSPQPQKEAPSWWAL